MMSSAQPPCCPICGQYLTTHPYFCGRRCLEPDHWLAAGLLQADDYYPLGQLVVQAALEFKQPLLAHKETDTASDTARIMTQSVSF